MKPYSGHRRFIGVLSLLGRLRLRPTPATAIALLLLIFPIGASTANAEPPASGTSGAHVYLLRGVLNIFSMGLDDIAAKLEQRGIRTTVTNYLFWSALADGAAAEYKSGRVRTIILVGHSSGATALPDMVARLSELGAPVKLAIGLDSVFQTRLSGRVGRYVNFYIANGAGQPVAKTTGFQGSLENVNVQKIEGVGHISIDKNQIMQQMVINAITAAVGSRPKLSSTLQELPSTVNATKKSSGTAGKTTVVHQ